MLTSTDRETSTHESPTPAFLARHTAVRGCPPPPSRQCCSPPARRCGAKSRFEQGDHHSARRDYDQRAACSTRGSTRCGSRSLWARHQLSQQTTTHSATHNDPAFQRVGIGQGGGRVVLPHSSLQNVCFFSPCVLLCTKPLLRCERETTHRALSSLDACSGRGNRWSV